METNNEEREFTRSHGNRQFHMEDDQNANNINKFDDEVQNRNFEAADEGAGSNMSTGYNVSGSQRKENFDDENYGPTSNKTAGDIKRNLNEEID